MQFQRMQFTCSAAELGNLDDYPFVYCAIGKGAVVAFVNTAYQKGAVKRLRANGYKRVGVYRGYTQDVIAVMLRIQRPILRKKTAKKVRK